jgi:1-deoxy-D-xylulose-5-phosphate reductoisomerase
MKVLILGSTGSIGCNALEVLRDLEETHEVVGISGHSNHALLIEQAGRAHPCAVGVTDPAAESIVRKALKGTGIKVLSGENTLCDLIDLLEPHIVLVAVSGAVGLYPSLAAVEQGRRLALANKESLVMAGHLLTRIAADKGAEIIPVDSEHSAVFQALRGEDRASIRKIILTASGGPFIDYSPEKLKGVTPAEALKHPTWEMGTKITIDSATMMNKALEIVEARWLFDLPPDKIDVVVHRQSIVHGLAEFTDGSLIAQMGIPDMKVPIRFALTYPARSCTDRNYFDPERCAKLTFEAPDRSRFPALSLGFRAAHEGGLTGVVLNAANERAVDLFLKGEITFVEITSIVEEVMLSMENRSAPSLEEIRHADQWAREETLRCTSH